MSDKKAKKDAGWNFDNSYSRLPHFFYTKMNPTPVSAPKLVILNAPLGATLGLDEGALRSRDSLAIFAGNQVPDGGLSIAQAYAGHQFGQFNRLGDGRAHLLGEQLTPQGERVDIQLKGSGKTPYSRYLDGRAGLGPMLREYIISEAMFALGIPTTRSLAVVSTGETFLRETEQSGAILTRVAASHIRFATFQYASEFGTVDELRALADYTLARHFPEAMGAENRYLALLQEVIKRQAQLIAEWQLVGFVHGVMNTDNIAVSGETIDYGPCAFLDVYDSGTVFSSRDTEGRYAYGKQPDIAAWNLSRFAETLLPLLHEDAKQGAQVIADAIAHFFERYHTNWLTGMRFKLGIWKEEDGDESLIQELLHLMQTYRADYTNTFRALTLDKPEETFMNDKSDFRQWYERWQARLSNQHETKADSHQLMRKHNPAIIPRNHRVEEALTSAVIHEDYTVMERLLEVISNPFAYSPEQVDYISPADVTACAYRTFCGT
ncbi:YdiU family protein [Paenibacillus sp. LMG 31461]|uniref:Protein nucleotidyltransferase YdiU n=1 Tax=Paenibacillus plantarum TaxID=2654975 RepID=A0ABX1XBK9_9BACL|nr:YdiU family protein [Paenibacillus plantarum]NOU65363.1 YdiU family protein [Paenibacillus plantarum]